MHLRGAAAAALFLAGCGLAASIAPGGGAENRCTADTDCPGAVCDRPLAICVAPHAAPATVYLRLAYQTPASTLVREVRVAEAGGGSGPASFVLPAPVAVEGVVRRPQPDGGGWRPVPATVTFSMPSGIPGLPPEDVTVISAAEVTGERTFSAYVVGGLHNVRIEPLGEDAYDLPPIAMAGLGVGEPSPAWLPVDYEAFEPFRTVEGYVTRIDGQAVPNLSVRAEDPATGRRISSIGSTGPIATTLDGDPPGSPTPDTGFFRIVLPRDVDTFRLVIAPTRDAPHFPTVVLDNLRFADLDIDEDGVVAFDSSRHEQSSVALPPVGRLVLFQGKVEGRGGPGFAPVPVPGATLRFFRRVETDLPDVTASFEQIATTNPYGSIVHAAADTAAGDGIWLPEGEYAVTIVAPAVGGYRSAHEPAVLVVAPLEGDPILRGRLFTLEPRAALNGEVVNLLGSGSAGSMPLEAILEQAAGGLRNADPANLNGVVRGRSDSDGGFGLLVEPGRHTLILRPSESSGFPWRIVRGIVAPDGRTRLALQAPVPLAGAVSAAGSGGPLPAVAVEAFYLPAGASAAIAVGRAQTDAFGSFTLLLPPRLDTI
ncbi:MAG: hypothetical protein QME96_00010 [Myxococcota bacterium]|nr:hypothetical protein [Myxococcota bacterium]